MHTPWSYWCWTRHGVDSSINPSASSSRSSLSDVTDYVIQYSGMYICIVWISWSFVQHYIAIMIVIWGVEFKLYSMDTIQTLHYAFSNQATYNSQTNLTIILVSHIASYSYTNHLQQVPKTPIHWLWYLHHLHLLHQAHHHQAH